MAKMMKLGKVCGKFIKNKTFLLINGDGESS